jgi:hypothetical protein
MPVFWVLAAIGLAGDDGEKPIAPEDGAPTGLCSISAGMSPFSFIPARQGEQHGHVAPQSMSEQQSCVYK